MKESKREHDRNLRAIQAQLLVVGVILLVIASVLLGLDLAQHLGPGHGSNSKTDVNITVNSTCVTNSKPPWSPIAGNG